MLETEFLSLGLKLAVIAGCVVSLGVVPFHPPDGLEVADLPRVELGLVPFHIGLGFQYALVGKVAFDQSFFPIMAALQFKQVWIMILHLFLCLLSRQSRHVICIVYLGKELVCEA